MQTTEYKVVVIGDTELGKSTFVKRLHYNLNNLFTSIKTLGVDVLPVELHGNMGKIRLNMWDCGGQYRGLAEGYYTGSNGAIIFKKSGNNNHLQFENTLPEYVKKFYITDYDMNNEEFSLNEYKHQLYNWIMG